MSTKDDGSFEVSQVNLGRIGNAIGIPGLGQVQQGVQAGTQIYNAATSTSLKVGETSQLGANVKQFMINAGVRGVAPGAIFTINDANLFRKYIGEQVRDGNLMQDDVRFERGDIIFSKGVLEKLGISAQAAPAQAPAAAAPQAPAQAPAAAPAPQQPAPASSGGLFGGFGNAVTGAFGERGREAAEMAKCDKAVFDKDTAVIESPTCVNLNNKRNANRAADPSRGQ